MSHVLVIGPIKKTKRIVLSEYESHKIVIASTFLPQEV